MSFTSSSTRPDFSAAATAHGWSPKRVKVLIVYCELTDARHVMDRLVRTTRATRGAVLHPMLWRIDQLNDRRWADASLADADEAGCIVFAMRSSLAFSVQVSTWLTSVLARKNRSATELMVLDGDEDPWTISIEHSAETSPKHTAREEMTARHSAELRVNDELIAQSA
jgi:hypothetical protein